MMGWCIGILLLIVGFVLFMIPGSQTIGWILWMAGIVCLGIQGLSLIHIWGFRNTWR